MAAEEKNMTGIDVLEKGFTAEPGLNPVEQLGADEFVVSPAEIASDMAAAGLEKVEKAEKAEKEPTPIAETAIGQEEGVFAAAPELSPLEQLGADEFVVSPAEVASDMEAAGLEKVEKAEKAEKEPTPIAETAIGMEEDAFNAVPELSPLEQLGADEFVSSQAEIADDMKKAGI